jgi:hypothetical protein
MKWTLRLLALASTTFCGIGFLIEASALFLNYNYEHHRFPLGMGYHIFWAKWFGLGFLCSAPAYMYLVQKMRRISN